VIEARRDQLIGSWGPQQTNMMAAEPQR